MLDEHFGVIHGVDVVAAQYNHIFSSMATHDVDILVKCVSSAFIPCLFFGALLRGQEFDKFANFVTHKAPASLQMAQ